MYVYTRNVSVERGVYRDLRHFESPSLHERRTQFSLYTPSSSSSSSSSSSIHTYTFTLISQWDLVSSCNSYLCVVRWSNNIIHIPHSGWVFIHTLNMYNIYESLRQSVIRIPMGGVFRNERVRARVCVLCERVSVCVARMLLFCTERRESITKIRWPAINPTRKMLSLFIFIFSPIWRTPTTRRDDHTIWSQFGGVVGTSHRRGSIVGVYENPAERKTGARNECGVCV